MMSTKKNFVPPDYATCPRKFWTMRIVPKERQCVGENLGTGLMVLQNHGPGKVTIHTDNHNTQVDLCTGQVQLLHVWYNLHIESSEDKFADVEFQYTPTSK
jgi:hypothetical protein